MSKYKSSFSFFIILACILIFSQKVALGGELTPAASLSFNSAPSDTIPGKCPMNDEIEKIIGEAISLGAPAYNAGMHMACYRIYEWASYKILYEYGKDCLEITKMLKTAIDKSHGDYSDTEKAWIMRVAFDKILGQPTQTADPQKRTNSRNG
ncbi:hypothetical protein ACQ86N_26410 [Puia sp. P3]|uniref:hypothetical protein n=1 Tax=Puia sp. P3 TaxID=3423952 RepID=UPI003D665FA4